MIHQLLQIEFSLPASSYVEVQPPSISECDLFGDKVLLSKNEASRLGLNPI